jgi:hypothetical protein
MRIENDSGYTGLLSARCKLTNHVNHFEADGSVIEGWYLSKYEVMMFGYV